VLLTPERTIRLPREQMKLRCGDRILRRNQKITLNHDSHVH
jgi:hypothetical protein